MSTVYQVARKKTPPPLANTHPYMSTSRNILFGSCFDHHFITGGTLNTTPHTEVRLKTASSSKLITPPRGYRSPATRTGMDASTEATALLHQSGPDESAASTLPVPAVPASRAATTPFIAGISPPTLPAMAPPVPRYYYYYYSYFCASSPDNLCWHR